MLDYDRLSCVLELLKSFDHGSKIASKLIQNYFRSNKNIGSKDRKFISKCFWNLIKNRNKINWHLKNHNLNYKIREHSLSKVPVLLICGKKEVDSDSVTIRELNNKKQENMKLKNFIKKYSALNQASLN